MINKIFKTKFSELKLFSLTKFKDNRGYFEELFNKREFKEKLNINFEVKMVCTSLSKKNVIRGFHYQIKKPMSQIVFVKKGKILDVVVDIRKKSKTFGKYESFVLSEKNRKALYMPRGFAHGFCGLDKENLMIYNISNYYIKTLDKGIKWDDKNINFPWSINKPIISKKDKLNPELKNAKI